MMCDDEQKVSVQIFNEAIRIGEIRADQSAKYLRINHILLVAIRQSLMQINAGHPNMARDRLRRAIADVEKLLR
jgi:hypothetical protein